jgi:protocatechuate 3,4-dioxygenase beta subunit
MSTPRHDHPQRGLSRRELIAAAGALGLGSGLLVRSRGDAARAATAPACVLAPETTQGPYYIANHLVRRDITEVRPGLPLMLHLSVVNTATCSPIRNATVEVWHADALGVYSGFGSGQGLRFLRGAQRTDARGRVTFRTVYPGWYRGRATHIHVKVHAGGRVVHTGQLFFDQLITDGVYRSAPYAAHGQADTANGQDAIFAAGGARSMLSLHRRSGSGYDGTLAMGVKV